MPTNTDDKKNAPFTATDHQEDSSIITQTVPRRIFRPPQPGTSIWQGTQRYQIGDKISQGSFGTVYYCVDDWGNQLVAKVLSPQGTYDEVRERWMDEANKLINLRHPNTTYVHDIFEHDDTFYIIMEYCALTLQDLIQKTPSFDGNLWLMPIARCILQAVNFMHSHGYVHKDLHHKNIFAALIPDEMAGAKISSVVFKVGDFGISRLEGDIDPINTLLAQWMLPPESLNPNDFGVIGRVTDIYHIGLLFLSILEGRIREFTHEEILSGEPRLAAEQLNSPYSAAIAKALRRRTNLRTQNALEFWRDLQAAASSAQLLK